ncbi:MAG TPA: prenyltransferase [Streptosporangiaceae bacterium]|nr:prenyltransferase [Streptosporangiaceae bacterium]
MRGRERPDGWVPEVAGILTTDQLIATGESIAAAQQGDGAIGWPDGHVDAWNHVECAMALSACGLRGPARRAYAWLAATQRPDGSWPVQTADGIAADLAAESNHAVYPAVGIWHEFLVTGDAAFAARMWPLVRAGVEFALGLQAPGGQIIWRRRSNGAPDDYALLAGCASMYHGLRCAIALADHLGHGQPDWELAADQLGHAVACHDSAFADKSRFAMDWYYPVLGGPLRDAGPQAAASRIAQDWDTFVVPGLGIRCVSDQPWVTGAETCELAIALDTIGDQARALDLLDQIQHLRDPAGGYWTGWQFVNQAHFPREQSSWTAAAVVLAADALSGATGGAGIFADAATGRPGAAGAGAAGGTGTAGRRLMAGTAACGCASADPVSGPL